MEVVAALAGRDTILWRKGLKVGNTITAMSRSWMALVSQVVTHYIMLLFSFVFKGFVAM